MSKMPKTPALKLALLALLVASGASPAGGQNSESKRLPTGQRLDPAGETVTLGSMPLATLLAPGGPQEGATPNALVLSRNGTLLFVAEADNNAVAIFNLAPARPRGSLITERPMGRIPTDWYPTSVLERAGQLLIVCGKGRGATPNPDGPTPGRGIERPLGYTLGQLNGTLRIIPGNCNRQQLAALSRRVAAANGCDAPARPLRYPLFKHVVYIIKENRTYDQVFGDVPGGDGDPSLVFFGLDSTPNHRTLAARFGLFDRFFTNAEVRDRKSVV